MSSLAQRLGITRHFSPLLYRVNRLRRLHPAVNASTLEEWMMDLANARGATVVTRLQGGGFHGDPPGPDLLNNEELTAALLSVACDDRPELLRLAGQFLSRNTLDLTRFHHLAQRERLDRVLKELATQALRADPTHPTWTWIARTYAAAAPLRDSLLHWTRLAEPIMRNGRYNAERWQLVA